MSTGVASTDSSVTPVRLGRYALLRHLATGGMAEIHLARAVGIERFEKLVVVKRILPHLARNDEFVRMFLDEARLAATLHHSNIVQVFDIGADGNSYFFSMEYLHGVDVRRMMQKLLDQGRTLPIEHAITIMLAACAGLHYAHEKKSAQGTPLALVHRDISPQNIFVTYDGGVKIVDFGIAKAADRVSDTREGTLKGKIPYMSPEQCLGNQLDRRSDVFSLAIFFWEITVGRRLFKGASEFATMQMITEGVVTKPSSVMPDYPPALEEIVLKGLARERDARYQSTEEMALAIEAFARTAQLSASTMQLGKFMSELFPESHENVAELLLADIEQPKPEKPRTAPPPLPNDSPYASLALDEVMGSTKQNLARRRASRWVGGFAAIALLSGLAWFAREHVSVSAKAPAPPALSTHAVVTTSTVPIAPPVVHASVTTAPAVVPLAVAAPIAAPSAPPTVTHAVPKTRPPRERKLLRAEVVAPPHADAPRPVIAAPPAETNRHKDELLLP